MPLTPELIDAAKAELPPATDSRSIFIRINDVLYERRNNGVWVKATTFESQPQECLPAFDRALSRAHLAEARRLGAKFHTLEELEAEGMAILAKHVYIDSYDFLMEFLTHLKSLPNA